jgi:hypothetical protein
LIFLPISATLRYTPTKLGETMLGYELSDQEEMVVAIALAMDSSTLSKATYEGLDKAYMFLQGLWAEGYFD